MNVPWLAPGSNIWFKNQNKFQTATVLDRDDKSNEIKVQTIRKSQQKTSLKNCFQKTNQNKNYEDMCSMRVLNEPQILFNLKRRYQIDTIYTNIGPTLIAINPYKGIQQIYGSSTLNKIKQRVRSGALFDDLNPHVYLLTGKAYHDLKQNRKKQAIIISGQSGAGKTQNTKYCMTFLSSLSQSQQHSNWTKNLQDIILQCNPILEAFGNAKTVKNSNSSRFGKFIRLYFNENDKMIGSKIQNYLLEKSRVTSVAKNQRNFHIFYYLINSQVKQISGLTKIQKYHYLQSNDSMKIEGVDQKVNFQVLHQSLRDLGFSNQFIIKIWKIIGTILLLGNLDVKEKYLQTEGCEFVCFQNVQQICLNLQLNINEFQELVLEQKLKVGKQVLIKRLDKQKCKFSIDTLSKALYSKLFDNIIDRINQRLWKDKSSDRSISILDIFGFEVFEKNSFEQLCINFANQKLQKLYTKHIFEKQLEQLKRDGLAQKVKQLIPPDNRLIIELIEKRVGISIFSLIDQKTALGAAKDEDLINEFRKIKHKNLYIDSQPNKTSFMILHTQSVVTYSVQGFRQKNQDMLSPQIDSFLNSYFQMSQNQQFKGKTLATKFDKQLRQLNNELQQSEIHFIRCLKPNQQKLPNCIDQPYLLQQIRYLGILQTIQIRKSAFPLRIPYNQFLDNYIQLIIVQKTFLKLSITQKCMTILRKLLPGIQKQKHSFLLGKQRLYLKQNIESKLKELLIKNFQRKRKAVEKIQLQFIRYIQRKKIKKGVQDFLHRSHLVAKILIKNFKKIKIKYFKIFQTQIELTKKINETNKIKQEQNKKSWNKILSKISNTGVQPSQLSTKDYQTTLYDTQKPFVPPIINLSQEQKLVKKKQLKVACLNTAYIYQSQPPQSNSSGNLMAGELKVQKYIHDQQKIQNLRKTLSHVIKQEQTNNLKMQFNEQNIKLSVDDKYIINQNSVKGEIKTKLMNFDYLAFFKRILRKRKTLFNIKKTTQEIMMAKDGMIGMSLILIPQKQQPLALKIFKLLLWIGDSHKTQKIYDPIQRLLQDVKQASQYIKNQVFVQIIKQQNTRNEYSSIKMYQMMLIYIHTINVEQQFLLAYICCLIERNESSLTSTKIKGFINFTFSRILRKLTQNNQEILYIPDKFQIAAMLCKRQLLVLVYLSVGNPIVVWVQSYQKLRDIKKRVLDSTGVNTNRLSQNLFGFSSVVNFDNDDLEDLPLDDDRNVWDLIAYWERIKQNFSINKSKAPQTALYLKIKYAFELHPNDEQGIQLCYAQTYFDLFIGKIKLNLQKGLDCSALILACEPQINVNYIFPSYNQIQQFVQKHLPQVIIQSKKYSNLSRKQLRFKFIQNCSSSPLIMTIGFPTDQDDKIYLKPRLFIIQNSFLNKHQQISIKKIKQHQCNNTKIILKVKDNNIQRQISIDSTYSQLIAKYIVQSIQFIIMQKAV